MSGLLDQEAWQEFAGGLNWKAWLKEAENALEVSSMRLNTHTGDGLWPPTASSANWRPSWGGDSVHYPWEVQGKCDGYGRNRWLSPISIFLLVLQYS